MIKNFIYDLNCIRKLRKRAVPIVIYQMGKVGSKSIHNSLRRGGYAGGVFHTHTLRYDHVRRDLQRLYDHIHVRQREVKIVSMVREPFSRNLSSFFQRLHRHMELRQPLDAYDLDELMEVFLRKYDHREAVDWFDRELRRVTGVNIYDYPLQQDGSIRAIHDNVDLLLFKCELNDSRKERLMREYLGQSVFELQRENVSSEKRYGQIYRELSRRMVYPKELVEELIGSRYFKHFYETEKAAILSGLKIC